MKAFHLGAFEVMVVTDDRLSESGGGGGGAAFTRFCVYACARSSRHTERPLMEPLLSWTQTHGRRQQWDKGKRGELFDPLTLSEWRDPPPPATRPIRTGLCQFIRRADLTNYASYMNLIRMCYMKTFRLFYLVGMTLKGSVCKIGLIY